uniref:Probable proton-coupled zinc antiporter SLC30A3 n=1 Tax=Melopsittacus undulatus TaxID=13146 RepID=A0A8C6IT35_MELUD
MGTAPAPPRAPWLCIPTGAPGCGPRCGSGTRRWRGSGGHTAGPAPGSRRHRTGKTGALRVDGARPPGAPGSSWGGRTGVLVAGTAGVTPAPSLFAGSQDTLTQPGPPALAPHCRCSPRAPSPGRGRLQARRQLSIACTLCCIFMIGEVIETLGALASVLSIWVVTGALVYLAAARIISNDYEIEARAMLATSASAVGVNLSTGGCLVRAAFVHVVGDLLQSISVLVAATIIYFKPQCKIADPISTLFFSVFVLGSTFTILRDVFRVLMEGTPRDLEFDAVKEMLLAVNGVKGVHDLHLWALTLSHHTIADPEMVLHEATTQLQSRFGFASCTVQVERYQEEMMGCQHCKDPCA